MRTVSRKYSLDGLDCADCAAKIERSVMSLPEVFSCDISLMTSSIKLVYDSSAEEEHVLAKVRSIADSIEPGMRVLTPEPASAEGSGARTEAAQLTGIRRRIFAGAALFILTELAGRIFPVPAAPLLVFYIAAYLILGSAVLLKAGKNILRGKIFDENFLMSLATVGAFFIGSPEEAVAVMLFYQIGEAFQLSALHRSKNSVRELTALRPEYANRKTETGIVRVAPEEIAVGDTVVVKAGERIPMDGTVVSGRSSLNTAALTGESTPVDVDPGDAVLSGSVCLNGVLEIEVTKPVGESAASRMIALVTEASARKSQSETVISRFARIYTPLVVLAAFLLATVPLLFGGDPRDYIYRALSFLVISCPCALVLSVPLGYFAGIGAAGRQGIFVKGGGVFDALAKVRTAVFDKTGTLTDGFFTVSGLVAAQGISERDLLTVAMTAERYSDHPIAVSVLTHGEAEGIHPVAADPSLYRETAGQGIYVALPEDSILAGNLRLMRENKITVPDSDTGTDTILYVARGKTYLGMIRLTDAPKKGTPEAMEDLRDLGVGRIVMLTGDRNGPARAAADKLGITEIHAELLPEQKLTQLEAILSASSGQQGKSTGTVLFAGDGINDAPVLARADIGVSVGGKASGAAVEAADLVIMTEDIGALPKAVRIAKRTKKIVTQSIVISLLVKAVILLAAMFGFSNLWLAVFADVGVTLLAVLNALRAGRSLGLRRPSARV